MLRNSPQSLRANMAFADMPLPVAARVERRLGIIEVHRAHVLQADRLLNYRNRRFEAIFFANVVTRGERMSGIDADPERQFRTSIHDRGQMLKTMTDAFPLS